ncbi:hypothetical protein M9Y10_020242 [Tritrichomonas musculus]|uniref:Uncharacterized protein n=1 Tax=Tritrichomonas musculus TaxID=1915356 RepID=A0ABR2HFM5_9EUKA
MDQTTESRFVRAKTKVPLSQVLDTNRIQESSKLQPNNYNLHNNRNKYISPAQALKEMNYERDSIDQRNQQKPKNIWMSSIRDIIRDEPVKITQIKKTPAQPKLVKNNNKAVSPIRPKSKTPINQSKPVFMMAPSLKNLIEEQPPEIEHDSSPSRSPTPDINVANSPKNISSNNKPKFSLLEKQKSPKKVTISTMGMSQNTLIFNQSPKVKSCRSPSPIPKQSLRSPSPIPKQSLRSPSPHNSSNKSNRFFRALCVLIFLIVMFLILFLLSSLL